MNISFLGWMTKCNFKGQWRECIYEQIAALLLSCEIVMLSLCCRCVVFTTQRQHNDNTTVKLLYCRCIVNRLLLCCGSLGGGSWHIRATVGAVLHTCIYRSWISDVGQWLPFASRHAGECCVFKRQALVVTFCLNSHSSRMPYEFSIRFSMGAFLNYLGSI